MATQHDGAGAGSVDKQEDEAVADMPTVWRGRRRFWLLGLGALGVTQAVLAVVMALTTESVLGPETTSRWEVIVLVGAVLGVGLARWIERVWAESLGQDYVFEQRQRLIISAVANPDYRAPLGVTVTRASNDLTAVRNWIALGMVPLVTGVPMIVIVVAALFFIDAHLGLAVLLPLAVILVITPILAQVNYRRSRELRKQRGRMSARIADTVLAGESIRVSGAVLREVKAVDRDSERVVNAAVNRARISGLTRSLMSTASSMATVSVVLVSLAGAATAANVASAMLMLGVLATPITDLGRVVEYRQNYRAASRILAPLLNNAEYLRGRENRRRAQWRENFDGQLRPDLSRPAGLRIQSLVVDDEIVPDLDAAPGEKIRLVSEDPHHIRQVIATLGSMHVPNIMTINGLDYSQAPGQVRRELIGLASVNVPLERGSIKRLVSFRLPGASAEEIRAKLEKVGLWPLVHSDERGWNLQLKNDGHPWPSSAVMQLKVARALLGHPPLLILEGVDSELNAEATDIVHSIIDEYEGVVLFSSTTPGRVASAYREWVIEGEHVAQEDRTASGYQDLGGDDE